VPDFEIRRIEPGDLELVLAAGELFDSPPQRETTARFLGDPDCHLLMSFVGDRAVGFVSGIEMVHPDKTLEMFLYELSVAEDARGRGIGTALVTALRELAHERGCRDVWVLADSDNEAALATYRRAGLGREETTVMFEWDTRSPS
jgi:ribosomal protein S18 acetylase RimI-like enzyme